MLKAWNKDGKEIEVKEKMSDEDCEESFKGLLMMLSMISQETKEIITKVEIDSPKFKLTVEQK